MTEPLVEPSANCEGIWAVLHEGKPLENLHSPVKLTKFQKSTSLWPKYQLNQNISSRM